MLVRLQSAGGKYRERHRREEGVDLLEEGDSLARGCLLDIVMFSRDCVINGRPFWVRMGEVQCKLWTGNQRAKRVREA